MILSFAFFQILDEAVTALFLPPEMRKLMKAVQPHGWRHRVAAMLSDPVAHALLRADGLTIGQVLEQLTPVAETLKARAAGNGMAA
jgi:thiamine monophosphate synthase